MARHTAGVVSRLEEHPNLAEILGVLAQLSQISDSHVEKLAALWTNTVGVAEARDRALAPDSPLVVEALSAFDALTALFEDDLRGDAPYLTVEPRTVSTALKAVRDAIAAAYARPALARGEHTALIRPWRSVFPAGTVEEPDLGPRGEQVKALLAALPQLSTRCHDAQALALWEALVDQSFAAESDRADASEQAFGAAVLTSRRRTWALVRRSGSESLARPCTTCRTSAVLDRETERVLSVCLDAACALLVADALADADLDLLVGPVSALIPQQRGPSR
jgi:hypothetical protein